MVLYSVAQSRPVLPGPPFPVVSMGMSDPPARIEPTLSVTKTFCSQAGLGRLNPPWLVQALVVSVTLLCSICTIWPIFSGSGVRPRRSLPRAWAERLESRSPGPPLAEAGALLSADADIVTVSAMASKVAVSGLRRRLGGLLRHPLARSRMLCIGLLRRVSLLTSVPL